MIRKFKVALLQNTICVQKTQTLSEVSKLIRMAVEKESKVCILGECFNSFYQKDHLIKNSENFADQNSETLNLISQLSKEFKQLIIGTIPEKEGDVMYNTAICFKDGELISKYRKTHLFDIDIPGKITYMESQTFSPGNQYSILDTEYGKFGIGICYDIRFPEFAQVMRDKGCHFLIYPGAFNMTTGPIHWELLIKARAVDNQVYFAGVSAARYQGEDKSIYVGWGHSTIVDPMGKILATMDEHPQMEIVEVDLDYIDMVRQQIPVSQQRRKDLYELVQKQ